MRSLRMHESNLGAAGTLARLLVDETHALLLEVGKCCLEVVDTQCDVLDAAAAIVLLDELRNRGGILRCCQKLDLAAIRRREESRRDLLLCDGLLAVGRQAERLTPERADFLVAIDR